MENSKNKTYENIVNITLKEIPQMVDMCGETKTNLLIYGEPGCGKSTTIYEMANKKIVDEEGNETEETEFDLVEIGAASMCEEFINGVPIVGKDKSISYTKPEWYEKLQKNFEKNPNKKQILFIDELTLAQPEVMNSLQILLTARKVPTQKETIPENVIIVSAANTTDDCTEGTELSRALKTRFVTVRLKTSISDVEEYVRKKTETELAHLKEIKNWEKFIKDTLGDFERQWNSDQEFYGTNARTVMNFYKMVNADIKRNGTVKLENVLSFAEMATGVKLSNNEWYFTEENHSTPSAIATKQREKVLITESEIDGMQNIADLRGVISMLRAHKKANTQKYIALRVYAQKKLIEMEKIAEEKKEEANE